MKKDLNFTERAVPTVTANFLMEEARARYLFASKYVTAADNVCDMACGTGYGSEILGKKGKLVIGIDISDEALEFAIQKFARAHISFVKMDALKTLFKDKTFSVITAFEMIEHLSKPKNFLAEMSRILAPRGVCILSTPNRLIQSPDGNPMSPYHTKEYSPEEFERLLKTAFTKVELFGQRKSERAEHAVNQFMVSQKFRQFFVDIDVLGIRKLFSRSRKERIWKTVGALFGRNTQENVSTQDYAIKNKSLQKAEYIIAVCRK
jgi:2-polyprenyl-3-methyl-5-hydroxy-6-metoxy-1,4-benzoquinol methylase